MIVLRQMDLARLGLTGDALARAQRDVATFGARQPIWCCWGSGEAIFADRPRQPVGDGFASVHPAQLGLACRRYRLSLLTDAAAVFAALSGWPPLVIEAVVGMFALASLVIILSLRPKGESLVPPEPEPVLISGAPRHPGWRPAARRTLTANLMNPSILEAKHDSNPCTDQTISRPQRTEPPSWLWINSTFLWMKVKYSASWGRTARARRRPCAC